MSVWDMARQLARFDPEAVNTSEGRTLIRAVLARHSLSGPQVTMDALRQAYDHYYGQGEFARLLRTAAP